MRPVGPGRLARLVLRLTLALYPREFRRVFGEPIAEAFGDRYAERVGRGFIAVTHFLISFALDGVVSALRERVRPSHRPRTDLPTQAGAPAVTRFLDALSVDLHFALRTLARRPGFTATAVATLAIGIGASTAIFSLVSGVLLSPLSFAEPEGLVDVAVAAAAPGERPGRMSYPDIVDLADRSPSLESLVGTNVVSTTVTGLGDPFVMDVNRVTEGVLATFRATPELGRDILAEEFGPNGPGVAVIGYTLWQERYGGDPDVVGQTITLEGFPYEVVGVAPRGFQYPSGVDLWIPRRLDPEGCGRPCHTMIAVGRLAPGATLEGARAEVAAIESALAAEYPESNGEKRFLVRSLKKTVVGDVEAGLWLLLAAVGLVLLIACANVANLLLARASSRENEIAVRAALGASGRRLSGQALVESAVLAVAGGAAGVAFAMAGVDLLRSVAATTVPRVAQITVDGPVLAVAAGCTLLATLVFGLAPLAGRRAGRAALAGGARGASADRTEVRFRGALVAGEVALAVVLLVGAGLLLRTFAGLYAVDTGFSAERVLRFNVDAPAIKYTDMPAVRTFFRTLEARIAALPGVEAVGSMNGAPLSRGRASGTVYVEGRPDPEGPNDPNAYVRPVSPGMIDVLGIRVVRGRALSAADDIDGAEPVALVNEEFARRHFPGEDALGRRVRVGVSFGLGPSIHRRIVGVVEDVRFDALTIDPLSDMYIPHGQFGPDAMTIHVRAAGDPDALLPAIQSAVRALDPNVPIHGVEAMEDAVASQLAPTRLYVLLLGAFAAAAGLLAAVGLYGVVSFVVARRVREYGVRVALGSNRAGIMSLVLGQGMRPALTGLALGVAAALAASRVLEAVLYQVSPRDPVIFVSAPVLLFLVTMVAAVVPAIRASRLDAARMLRMD